MSLVLKCSCQWPRKLSLSASIVLKILMLIIMFLCMANYHSLLIPCSYYCLIWLHHYEVAE